MGGQRGDPTAKSGDPDETQILALDVANIFQVGQVVILNACAVHP
jgi:hypothetical protein